MWAYCSWCFKRTRHRLFEKSRVLRDVRTCSKCENRTLECRMPRCTAMAKGGKWDDELCAVHDGTIANFDRLDKKIGALENWPELFKRDSLNVTKIAKTAAFSIGGAAVLAPVAFAAAPAVGSAIGSFMGFSGFVARAAGLAYLGGGPVALGGMGMAGGVGVITATGAALGGTYGGAIAQTYFSDVEGFDIKRIKSGRGPAVIVIDGFLTEGEMGDSEWRPVLKKRFGGHPWYRLTWEAKRLKDLGSIFTKGLTTKALTSAVKQLGNRSFAKAVGRIMPFGLALTCLGLAKNPWHVAMVKADQTGTMLAEILARVHKRRRFILVGHSLGARVIYGCLNTLATKREARGIVLEAHLLGGAVGNAPRKDWAQAVKAVRGRTYTYYSKHDQVLKVLYRIGTAFTSKPIGLVGGPKRVRNLRNTNVSRHVDGHLAYKRNAPEFLQEV